MARPKKEFATLPDGSPKFYTTQALCAELHVSEKTVQRWRNANLITYILKGGGRYLYPASDVDRFVASRTVRHR
jgi:predicted site-specific integrase-resolvase